MVPVLLLVFLVMAAKFGSFTAYGQLLGRQTYTALLPALGAGYTLLMLLLQGLRTVLWACYRPYPLSGRAAAQPHGDHPRLQRRRMVEMALNAVARADYPADRLEIICVDDGSTDDTWDYIATGPGALPRPASRPSVFRANRGKKAALYAGFIRRPGARSWPPWIRTASSSPRPCATWWPPSRHDASIGAVAGNVKVYNRHQSFMGKMQGVRFVNLDFLRASQSLYKTVICTPGSLSAYRRAALCAAPGRPGSTRPSWGRPATTAKTGP